MVLHVGCTCDKGKRLNESKDKERLYEFLMGLDSEYSTIKTQILAMKPIPSLGVAYHLVTEDERQQTITVAKKHTNKTANFQAFFQGRKGDRRL